MPLKNAGQIFDLTNDALIFQINSPQPPMQNAGGPYVTGGPYVVVIRDVPERWIIVAFDWNKEPALGIRWFYGRNGHPNSRGYATWLVIPGRLYEPVMADLEAQGDLSNRRRILLNRFLYHGMPGDELRNQYWAAPL